MGFEPWPPDHHSNGLPTELVRNLLLKWAVCTPFFLKKIWGYKSFLWGHWYPCFGPLVMSALSFKARVDPFCVFSYLCDLQIHLCCDTCWLYRGQHGSQAFFIHIPADVSTSIGGGAGLEPMTVHAACCKHGTVYHLATPAWHHFKFWTLFISRINRAWLYKDLNDSHRQPNSDLAQLADH